MKINIITFHKALNCGAILQAYALSRYLTEEGHDVSIIDYCPKWTEDGQVLVKNLFSNFSIKKIILFPFQKAFRKKCDGFLKKYCPLTTRFKKGEQLLDSVKGDAFITGSDQVWNWDIIGEVDCIYLLDFSTNAKKISYAASCGYDEIPESMIEPIANAVKDFDAISVREHTLERELKIKGVNNVCSVWDPVFLLEKSKYLKIAKEMPYKKYLLIYTKGKPEGLRKLAKKVADELGLKIVDTSKIRKTWPADYVRAVYGPREFLGLFAGAEFVVTNSFHGTAFSIVFRRNFYALDAKNRTSRISSLLEDIGLKERLVNVVENVGDVKGIDYACYEDTICKYIENSKLFLENALQV